MVGRHGKLVQEHNVVIEFLHDQGRIGIQERIGLLLTLLLVLLDIVLLTQSRSQRDNKLLYW